MISPFSIDQQDCIEWLRSLPSESVDLVVTDPAYESLEKHRAKGTTTRLSHSDASSNDWFDIFPNERFEALLAECYRVMKSNTHLYLMCDQETMFVVKPIAEAAGFTFWKPLVWNKKKIGMGYHYRAQYEFVLFFEKGKRELADFRIPDVISVPRVDKGYPTEKPTELAKILIRQSSRPGQLVIDPFLGSGSTGVAALECGRRFAGCDVSPKSIAIANARLSMIAMSALTPVAQSA